MSQRTIVVGGGGGFIGGHLVGELKKLPDVQLRVVDVKPLDQWYQVHPEARGTSSLI